MKETRISAATKDGHIRIHGLQRRVQHKQVAAQLQSPSPAKPSRILAMRVPLPTPDGPTMTKGLGGRKPPCERPGASGAGCRCHRIALQEAWGPGFVAQRLEVAQCNREAPKQWGLDGFSLCFSFQAVFGSLRLPVQALLLWLKRIWV